MERGGLHGLPLIWHPVSACILYTSALSANARKVLALAAHLGVDAEIRDTNVYEGAGRTPEYLAVNPQGKIPALVQGDLALCESNAILQFLVDAHGGARLASGNAAERAMRAQWLFWEASLWQPVLTTLLSGVVGHHLVPGHVPKPESPVDWEDGICAPVLAHLEHHLDGRNFLVRDELTHADFSVAGMTTYFAVAGFPFDRYPHIAAWCRRLDSIPAWEDTLSEIWRV